MMPLRFKSRLLIIISYFDEIYGPQVLELFPRGQMKEFKDILSILTILVDVSSASTEENWQFLYADQNFASQNIKMSLLNPEARGGMSDLMISLVMVPPHPQHIAAMAQDWNNIYQLQGLMADKIKFDGHIPKFTDENINQLLGSVHEEIIEQFQFFLDLLAPDIHSIE